MNYIILKSIIEATIINFKCKNCESWISEWNLNILGTAGNNINMEVICPNCKISWVVKAEFWLMNNIRNPDFINNLKAFIGWNKEENKKWLIKDEDIVSLRNWLNSCSSIEDLFKN